MHYRLEKGLTAIAGLILLTSITAFSQINDYTIGFKIISTYDSSRTYKPTVAPSDKLHFRPIDIDIWYPADVTSTDTTASFAGLVQLLEQRSSFYDDTKDYSGLTAEMLQYICAGTNCTDYNSLRSLKTNSFVNAKPVHQRFPLILYLASFNGMSFENHLLFERLVKRGFVVAAVSSIGRYPGNMTMDVEDLLEQVEDAKFIIRKLKEEDFVANEVGLVGYSWGGLAAAMLGMEDSREIKAIVSLDGSEQFVYTDREESEKLTKIRSSKFFKPEAFNAPFLYLDSDLNEMDNLPDSVYNVIDHIPNDKCYLKINRSTHEDFSSLSVLNLEHTGSTRYEIIQQLTIHYFLDKLKKELSFQDNIPSEMITRQFYAPTSLRTSAHDKTLKGVISDKRKNTPLPYVSLGILNKDRGTTTNTRGEFELVISEATVNDTLRVSMIGYEPRIFIIRDLLQANKKILNIALHEKTNELREVVVTDKKLHTKILGNKTDSKFFGGKFAPGDLGSEIAIKINIKNNPTYLDKFSFNISYNTEDTATFRVNIYEARNGLPGENILPENIILKVNGQTGKIEVDLTKYDLAVTTDIFIALEWIEGRKNSGIVFSAGLMNKGTYYRKASQGRWKKSPVGVGFNLTTNY